jgi:hypothetical protein
VRVTLESQTYAQWRHRTSYCAKISPPVALSRTGAAYHNLANHGYQHGTVNHTIQFVYNGITTNHVESFLSRVKRRLKYIYGSCGELQWSRLDEAQYRLWFGWTNTSVFANWLVFLQHVRDLYRF